MSLRAIHMLKTHPEPFAAAWRGDKPYEIRDVSDRRFHAGDELVLYEFLPDKEYFTGRFLRCEVTYMSAPGTWGLPQNICVLGTRVLERKGDDPNGGVMRRLWEWAFSGTH